MFKSALRSELASIYNMNVSDFGGDFDAGANCIYVVYGDVRISEKDGESVHFDIDLELMINVTKDSVYFGLLTLPYLKYCKNNNTSLKPVGTTETPVSISVDTLSISKQFTYSITMEHDKVRQFITEIQIDDVNRVEEPVLVNGKQLTFISDKEEKLFTASILR